MMRTAIRAGGLSAALAVGLLPACAISVERSSEERAAWVREELYFGAEIPGGGEVTDAEWERFLEEEIAPRFPDGLTVLDGEGRYRYGDGGTAREATRLVVLVRPTGDESADRDIEAIVEAYKRRFRQESVLRVSDRVEARF